MSSGSSSLESPRRHGKYYIPDGNVIFLVDGVLFRVHRHFFVRESAFFESMLSIAPPPGEIEGSSDSRPIHIPQVDAADFASFLWVFYSTIETWHAILSLADKWDFRQVKNLALQKIRMLEPTTIQKAVFSRKFDLNNGGAESAYADLTTRSEPLDPDEEKALGAEVSLKVWRMREQIRDRHAASHGHPYEATYRARTLGVRVYRRRKLNPQGEQDLKEIRSTFGLPSPAAKDTKPDEPATSEEED